MKLSSINRLRRDTKGTILVLFAVSLAVFLGFIALSFDLGRVGITQTELQSYADSVALAAAGELDGNPDSITRANNAAKTLIQDHKTFGSGDSNLGDLNDYTLTFFSSLPSSDLAVMTNTTIIPRQAAFVRATATTSTVYMPFAAAFSALSDNDISNGTVGASAVAGFTTYACDIAPMMFCIPPGYDPDAPEAIGDMIQLRSGGGVSGQWGPGNFGFLEPPDIENPNPGGDCSGFNESALEWCMLAAQSPGFCYPARGVDTRPGQSVGRMAAAVNTRFDVYEGVLNSYRHYPAFGPAPNIISGNYTYRQGNAQSPQCKAEESTDTIALPRDDCFAAGCTGGRFGDGDFSLGLVDYVATNYGTAPSWFPENPKTRYEIYLAELANSPGNILTDREETGRPACNANTSPSPERRVITAAGIDCNAPRNDVSGRAEDLIVDTWIRVFITEPADTVTKDIMVEVIGGGVEVGEAGSIHYVVELFR